MQHLKVGDWVRSTKYKHLKPMKIKSIYKSNTRLGILGLRSGGSVLYSDEVKLWTPELGEWVIPDTGVNEDMFVVMKYNGVSLIPNRCEPFIGKLPSNLKGFSK